MTKPTEIHECPEPLARNKYYDGFLHQVTVVRTHNLWYCGPRGDVPGKIQYCSACGVTGIQAIACCPFCGVKLAELPSMKNERKTHENEHV